MFDNRQKKDIAQKIQLVEILLIDDQPNAPMLTGMQEFLGKSFNWTAATNAKEALAQLSVKRFDLVVLDGDLGDQDYTKEGAAGQIAKELLDKGIPFVRLTGLPEFIPSPHHGLGCFSKGKAVQFCRWIEDRFDSVSDPSRLG